MRQKIFNCEYHNIQKVDLGNNVKELKAKYDQVSDAVDDDIHYDLKTGHFYCKAVYCEHKISPIIINESGDIVKIEGSLKQACKGLLREIAILQSAQRSDSFYDGGTNDLVGAINSKKTTKVFKLKAFGDNAYEQVLRMTQALLDSKKVTPENANVYFLFHRACYGLKLGEWPDIETFEKPVDEYCEHIPFMLEDPYKGYLGFNLIHDRDLKEGNAEAYVFIASDTLWD